MNEKHIASLKQYVNDMIGLERDIVNAITIQREDDRVKSSSELKLVLDQVLQTSERRIGLLKDLTSAEDGAIGAALKEGITSITGLLAGIYGKVREHPVSRMVRDDVIALDVSSVSYGMLLTLGLSIGHEKCVAVAGSGVEETPPLIIALTDLLPIIVAGELAADAPLANPAGVQIAATRIREARENC
jgi:hypothetical protein